MTQNGTGIDLRLTLDEEDAGRPREIEKAVTTGMDSGSESHHDRRSIQTSQTLSQSDNSQVLHRLDSNASDYSYDDFEDDSPYPEVRSAVANFDDPTIPVSTLRAWVIGIILAIILSAMNQFFYLRFPSVSVGWLVAQLVAFPFGRGLSRICPNVKLFGIPLNPGPFTIKEHVLVTIMASVAAGDAYATDIVAVQRVYYHQSFSFAYQWMLVMSTQLLGFSIGGIARRFLVTPPSMIWPSTLVYCALFNTLHSQNYVGIGTRDGISRERFFVYVLAGATAWYLLPGYLFQALSVFSWVCWIAPDNVVVNQLFGYQSGLGMSLLTFDWNQIAFIGSPLATPFWAQVNVTIGFILFYWILTPALYYSNVWDAAYLPISSASAYDNTGQPYNVSMVLDSQVRMNITAYKAYSPLFLSTTFTLTYALAFLSVSSILTHTIVNYWQPIKLRFQSALGERPDIHARLMSHYPQVPEWWYACVFAITFTFASVCITVWHTDMTIWSLVVALALALVYVIPIGMIQAITNFQMAVNVISEVLIGYMLPGRPIALMIFKTFGYITVTQAMQFTMDLKLGHYMKIPPRPMFWCQIVGTAIAGTVQLGVQSWMFSNINDMCQPDQKDNFTCESTHVFYTASVIWGVIGPALQFSKGHLYYAIMFMFIVGALCPVVQWQLARRFRINVLNYLWQDFPLLFYGAAAIPPATAVNFIPWAIVGFIFQYIIRRRNFMFWAKYNYILSAALDGGTAIGIILIYFCLEYPAHGTIGLTTIQGWWGNTVFTRTADWEGVPLKVLQPGQTFGPKTW